jgi:hypothetical protein
VCHRAAWGSPEPPGHEPHRPPGHPGAPVYFGSGAGKMAAVVAAATSKMAAVGADVIP